jgi:hypothetical protein
MVRQSTAGSLGWSEAREWTLRRWCGGDGDSQGHHVTFSRDGEAPVVSPSSVDSSRMLCNHSYEYDV